MHLINMSIQTVTKVIDHEHVYLPSLKFERYSYYINESRPKKLLDFDKICRISEELFTVCSDHCCGEFWEQDWGYCCTNDFKPLRNLLSFLMISFVSQLLSLISFLMVETIIEVCVRRKFKRLVYSHHHSVLSELQSLNNNLSSDDTTIEEDKSTAEEKSNSSNLIRVSNSQKQFMYNHSQNFKDMSRITSQKRIRRLAMKSRRSNAGSKSLSTNKSVDVENDPIYQSTISRSTKTHNTGPSALIK